MSALYSIHNLYSCFMSSRVPEGGITWDFLMEHFDEVEDQAAVLENGGTQSSDKWDVIRQFAGSDEYTETIVDDTVIDYNEGGNCTLVSLWVIAENDDVRHPVMMSAL